MPTIAYLANIFPLSVEPYVIDEVRELRKRGVTVIPCSALRTSGDLSSGLKHLIEETLYLEPLRWRLLLQATFLCIREFSRLKEFFCRALVKRRSTERRLPALVHTYLGAYYATALQRHRIEHIHVHHGYFGSWIAMVAARLLGIPFSITLHGSDLLVNAAYLDIKLRRCQFCVTISEFNRQHILTNYPGLDPSKIHVRRLGVDSRVRVARQAESRSQYSLVKMLAVGRLHKVKDHAFLVRACRMLKDRGLHFVCSIAGDGPERRSLEELIRDLHLDGEVRLLGKLPHHELDNQYEEADLLVLTSRSEGIPLALMEAMARGKIVLAPDITGIPELVVGGETGFLYQPGSRDDFVSRMELISRTRSSLDSLRRRAHEQVFQHFNREKNLAAFCELLSQSLRRGSSPISTAA
ncbi:MAG TPA: glycosyltransferase [Terriglobales bacterium]|nr:glycosyltransferase [Terriglobales bacterium]